MGGTLSNIEGEILDPSLLETYSYTEPAFEGDLVVNIVADSGVFWGPFWGAFLGLFSLLLVDLIRRYFKARYDDYRAIVSVQHFCVHALKMLAWNVKELKNLEHWLTKSLKDKGYTYYYLSFNYVTVDYALPLKLGKLGFLQNVINLLHHIDDAQLAFRAANDANALLRADVELSIKRCHDEGLGSAWLEERLTELIEMRLDLVSGQIDELKKLYELILPVLAEARVLPLLKWDIYLFAKFTRLLDADFKWVRKGAGLKADKSWYRERIAEELAEIKSKFKFASKGDYK
ncbi:hypothetical protein JKY72_01495 [Candidatus Gracilibacteria bacterium]|nr:hypothetical protein [Candidatus Gracilibacteria bacterium]